MNRPLIAISLLITIVVLIFHFAHVATDFEILLALVALILTNIGILTGR